MKIWIEKPPGRENDQTKFEDYFRFDENVFYQINFILRKKHNEYVPFRFICNKCFAKTAIHDFLLQVQENMKPDTMVVP